MESKKIVVQKGALSDRQTQALFEAFDNILVVDGADLAKELEAHGTSGLVLSGYNQESEWIINTLRKGGHDPWVPIALIADDEVFAPFCCEHFIPSDIEGLSTFLSSSYRPKILIIEDDDSLQDVLSQALSKHYDLTILGNGSDGFVEYKKNQYDLILTDYMLPGLTGLELIERIRLEDSSIPIIVITAHDTKALELQLLSYGANEYLPKPFTINFARKIIINVLATEQQKEAIRGFSEKEDQAAWEKWRGALDSDLG